MTIHITILVCTIILYIVLKKTFPESKSKKSRFAVVMLFPICMYIVYFMYSKVQKPPQLQQPLVPVEPLQPVQPIQPLDSSSVMSDPFPASSTMTASTSS